MESGLRTCTCGLLSETCAYKKDSRADRRIIIRVKTIIIILCLESHLRCCCNQCRNGATKRCQRKIRYQPVFIPKDPFLSRCKCRDHCPSFLHSYHLHLSAQTGTSKFASRVLRPLPRKAACIGLDSRSLYTFD